MHALAALAIAYVLVIAVGSLLYKALEAPMAWLLGGSWRKDEKPQLTPVEKLRGFHELAKVRARPWRARMHGCFSLVRALCSVGRWFALQGSPRRLVAAHVRGGHAGALHGATVAGPARAEP
jgi:hypothetical protein